MASNGRFITLDLVNTVDTNNTEYRAEGAYTSANFFRFRYGRPETISGFSQYGTDRDFVGVARDIEVFVELDSALHIAAGTHRRLEIEQNNSLYDITPIRTSVSAVDYLTATSGESTVLVSVASHGALSGAEVLISATSAVGGITLGGRSYSIVSVVSNNAFEIETSTTASSSEIGGGVVKIDFLLNPGNQSNGVARGWGSGTWGTPGITVSSGWGDPRGSGFSDPLRQWSLDVGGEDLFACPRGGRIYRWVAATSVTTRARELVGAPSANNIVRMAGPKRILMSYGCTPFPGNTDLDPMLVRWSDSENFSEWVASATNEAGDFRLQGGSTIIGFLPVRSETLVFTDRAVFSERYTGSQFVFSYEMKSDNAPLIAQHAAAEAQGVGYWMGPDKFYYYDGFVRKLPCTVEASLFENINRAQKEKIFCGTNSRKDEIIWLYPSLNSDEIDKYIIFNYVENSWYGGSLSRTVWADSGLTDNPIAIDPQGMLFAQEVGADADGSPLKKVLETAFVDLEEGTDVLFVDQIVPDLNITGTMNLTLFGKRSPGSTEIFTKGPFVVSAGTELISTRLRARQAKVRFSTSALGASFSLGKTRFRVRPDGER